MVIVIWIGETEKVERIIKEREKIDGEKVKCFVEYRVVKRWSWRRSNV
jgi:hypothetical protein